jgi:hypothetical protein
MVGVGEFVGVKVNVFVLMTEGVTVVAPPVKDTVYSVLAP